jgi:hypothetical protein
MQIMNNLLINLLSDLLSWVIVGVTLSLFALGAAARRRRELFDFLGISRSQPNVHVYISRVDVRPGGATMIGSEEQPIFAGPVVSAREFMILPELDRLFRSPFLDNLPHSARKWLGERFHSLGNTEVFFQPSPSSESEISAGTVILLGGRTVNVGTRYYQDTAYSVVDFTIGKRELFIARGTRKGSVIQSTSKQVIKMEDDERPTNDLAVMQRLHDAERKRTVIIAAGTGTNGTMAATLYLIRNWYELYRQFGKHDSCNFAVVIECPNRRVAENGYETPTTLGEFIG